MGIEIERKFLVQTDVWQQFLDQHSFSVVGTSYSQGYITSGNGRTVRVRIAGNQGYLTIKGPSVSLTRAEFEYPIPLTDAQQMLANLCDPPLIEKTRYMVPWDGLIWEVDVFAGDNQGLVLAEVELADEHQPFTQPDWVGVEVSHDRRYSNASLSRYPYRQWH